MAAQGTVARAFELAREGKCSSVQAIRAQLKREGYPGVAGHLEGRSITKQLKQLIEASAIAAKPQPAQDD